MTLSEDDVRRYARQIVLPEIGGVGQARLGASRVLVIGAGGLGSPLALYLAAAGIGTIGIVDFDKVDVSNLQRQIAFADGDVGRSKVDAMAGRLGGLNPSVSIVAHAERLTAANADRLVEGYDIVADGSDNLATRILVHDAAMRARKPLVACAVQGLDGQLTTYKAYLGPPHPCMRCLLGEQPSEDLLPSCAQGGVLGAAAGVMGSLQAVEVVKECLGMEGLSGRMVHYDAMQVELVSMRVRRGPSCPNHAPR